jgi:hypothetical protein
MTNQDKGNQSLGLSLTNRLALERTRIAKGLMHINRFVVIEPAILLASITASALLLEFFDAVPLISVDLAE